MVSFQLPRAELDDWTRLARAKGYSRSELMLLALREVGLSFARSIEPKPTGAAYLEPVSV